MHHNIADAVRRWYYEAPDGLTDEEIAARLGVSRRMVHNYRQQLGAIRIAPGPAVRDEQGRVVGCEGFSRP